MLNSNSFKIFFYFCFIVFLLCHSIKSKSQNIIDKNVQSINKKVTNIANRIDKKTIKYFKKLNREEEKIARRLRKVDSTLAADLFGNEKPNYKKIITTINNNSSKTYGRLKEEIPGLDSIANSLNFIDQNKQLFNKLKNNETKVKKALGNVDVLKTKLELVKGVENQIRERKMMLKQALEKYKLGKHLKRYNQSVYYYSEQIKEYKDIIKNPEKAEKFILKALHKVPAFNDFVQKNSFLSTIFGNFAFVGSPTLR